MNLIKRRIGHSNTLLLLTLFYKHFRLASNIYVNQKVIKHMLVDNLNRAGDIIVSN